MRLRVRWEDYGSEDPQLSKLSTLELRPSSLTVSINDYTEADTFRATIDYKDFPFDPRSIRAMGVTVFIEDMKRLFDGQENIRIQGKDRSSESNIVFIGFADEESIEFDDSARRITFEGRDFTSLLIDQPYIAGPLNMNLPLDQLVQLLLSNLVGLEKIIVENRTGSDLPTLSKFAPTYSESGGKRNTRKKETYWDVVQDLASKAGLIAYIELDTLVITKPRALYSIKQAKQFIYGRNLSGLEFKRKLGRQKGFNIIVRSMDLRNKVVIEAKIPLEASDAWASSIGIPQAEVENKKVDSGGQETKEVAPYISILIPDINSKSQLISVGENIFEELSRQQIEGQLTTKEMVVSYGTANNPVEFDITKLRTGEPIIVEIADERDLDKARRIKSVEERTNYFSALGYDRQFARVAATALGKFNPVFYTKAVQYQMDATGGFSCTVEFLNFIELPKALGNRQ